jgi:O-antigen ligase
MPRLSETKAAHEVPRSGSSIDRSTDRWTVRLFFALLCALSFFIFDSSDVSFRVVSALLLAFAAWYALMARRPRWSWSLPFVCPLLMSIYGLGQTAWSQERIVFNGLDKSLYWLTAAAIGFLATQLFQVRKPARYFRGAVAIFASSEALLSVLEQAAHTSKFFGLIPSAYPGVYGTFNYYNSFSQLVELALPVTLWEGIGHRGVKYPYLFLAALQIGAVVSSGSRAGALLVYCELLAILIIAWLRRRRSMSLAVIGFAIALSLGFTYVAGFQHVVEKLRAPDQLSNRTLLNKSSLAMIEARPLTGWGLGSYAAVYKVFALYDDGTWVNQAHNDYLEWAAEGGIPYACLMLVLIVWTIRPALRSVWGLGLLALCVHALVDYPFAHLSVCGWYFALAGMLAANQDEEASMKRLRSIPNPYTGFCCRAEQDSNRRDHGSDANTLQSGN